MGKILVTGAAGFIGFHLSSCLLLQGDEVFGIDNLNDYYEVTLKYARLSQLKNYQKFKFYQVELSDNIAIEKLFQQEQFDIVVNLAAFVGVRYSLAHPHACYTSNVIGFSNILEGCRCSQVKHLIFASSSSVYGANTKIPFSTCDNVDYPISPYAASKKANELMAYTYSHLYDLPTTGLRFFSVYGPWGRPDMALFKFTKSILAGRPIDVFNNGKIQRDFTYIDDTIEGVVNIINKIPNLNIDSSKKHTYPEKSKVPYKIYNIGNSNPVELMYLIKVLENCLDAKAQINMMPMQLGDALFNFADVDDLMSDMGFRPNTEIETGVQQFVDWYRQYYKTL